MKKIEKQINTYYAVTVWMLCGIPHICKYMFDNSDCNNMKQVNNFIKKLFHGISDDDMNHTLEFFK